MVLMPPSSPRDMNSAEPNPNRNFIILTPEYESNLQCVPIKHLESREIDSYQVANG